MYCSETTTHSAGQETSGHDDVDEIYVCLPKGEDEGMNEMVIGRNGGEMTSRASEIHFRALGC